jgi:hypothetical protein
MRRNQPFPETARNRAGSPEADIRYPIAGSGRLPSICVRKTTLSGHE